MPNAKGAGTAGYAPFMFALDPRMKNPAFSGVYVRNLRQCFLAAVLPINLSV